MIASSLGPSTQSLASSEVIKVTLYVLKMIDGGVGGSEVGLLCSNAFGFKEHLKALYAGLSFQKHFNNETNVVTKLPKLEVFATFLEKGKKSINNTNEYTEEFVQIVTEPQWMLYPSNLGVFGGNSDNPKYKKFGNLATCLQSLFHGEKFVSNGKLKLHTFEIKEVFITANDIKLIKTRAYSNVFTERQVTQTANVVVTAPKVSLEDAITNI
jgi:hypothetical protein